VQDRKTRLAFVVPRYGQHILGGAETFVREMAEALVGAGHAVEVFTTCATDLLKWENDLPAGTSCIGGVTVLRYPIEWMNRKRYLELFNKIVFNQPTSLDEQFEWLHTAPHSPQLYQAINRRLHDFSLFFFAPYPFPLIHYAAAIAPSHSVIWPCLHDENYAYLAPTQLMLRQARGLMFNTLPEYELAARRLKIDHPHAHIIGFGMKPYQADSHRFRAATGVTEPFVLYSGRLESSKNVPLLIDYFIRFKSRHPGALKLALLGDGPVKVKHPDVIMLGFKQGRDKLDVYSAASVLCQPSVNESFSIVIMESWLSGVPVLVHCDCDVTYYHVTQSAGGLVFCNYEEFEAALGLLTTNAELNTRMGEAGRQYVSREYGWPAVLARFETALRDWCTAPRQDGP
jgi:glycosyltransferase involved in cell wall biosynthesis